MPHRPELVGHKGVPILAHADLPIEPGPRSLQASYHRDERIEGQCQQECRYR